MDERCHYLSEDLKVLFMGINAISDGLSQYTKEKYNRINPMNENLADWKQKGRLVSGYSNNTIYESSTIIGDVTMGDNCWIGPFTILDGGGGLNIGNMVTIAAGAMIYTHDTLKFTLSNGKMPYEYNEVIIGDNCFIGSQAIILKGSFIGCHSLVAANSLVNGRVPPYTIVAGSPARRIGTVRREEDGSVSLIYNKKGDCDD